MEPSIDMTRANRLVQRTTSRCVLCPRSAFIWIWIIIILHYSSGQSTKMVASWLLHNNAVIVSHQRTSKRILPPVYESAIYFTGGSCERPPSTRVIIPIITELVIISEGNHSSPHVSPSERSESHNPTSSSSPILAVAGFSHLCIVIEKFALSVPHIGRYGKYDLIRRSKTSKELNRPTDISDIRLRLHIQYTQTPHGLY